MPTHEKQIEILKLKKRRLELQQQQAQQPEQAEPQPEVGESRLAGARQFAKSVGPEIAGGIGGAALANRAVGAIPHPVPKGLSFLATLLGAGGGAAGGDVLRGRLPGETPATLKSASQAGARGFLGEGVGRGIIAGGQKLLAPFGKTVTAETKEVLKTMEDKLPKPKGFEYIRAGGRTHPGLLPAEATESKLLDIVHNVSEASFGGDAIQVFKLNRNTALKEMAEELVDSFGSRAESDLVGELFIKSVAEQLEPSRMLAKTLYNTVDDITRGTLKEVPVMREVASGVLDASGKPVMTSVQVGTKEVMEGGVRVSTKSIKEWAKTLKRTSDELKGVVAENSGDDLVHQVLGMDDTISFKAAQELRSRFISRIDDFSITNKKAPALGKAKKFLGLIDGETGSALKAQNKEALGLWREANKIYKNGSKQFNNAFIRRLVKSADPDFGGSPEGIVKAIWKAKSPSNITRTKSAVDDATWKKIQSYQVQDILQKSVNVETNVINGKKLLSAIDRLGKSFDVGFSPAQQKAIKDYANVLVRVQSKQGEKTGKMLIQLTQGSMALGLLSTGLTIEAATVLIAPPVLGRLMTNPIFAKWLSEGLELPAGSPAAGALMGKIVAAMNASEKENEDYMSDVDAPEGSQKSFFDKLKQAETRTEQSQLRHESTLTPRLSQSLRRPPTMAR